jgi:hypothetical protein
MKLSALLLLGAAMCMAQAVTPRQSAVPSPQQSPAATEYEALPIPSPAVQAAIARDMERAAQANCPVVLTSAWLAPRLQLLKSADASADGNGLDLEFRNASGKAIRSMELSATILIKKSIYDLGYLPPVHLQLTAFGTRNIDSAVDELRRLTLPSEMHPALVDSVRLEQVTFADGSVWSPKTDQYCGLTPDPMRSIAR